MSSEVIVGVMWCRNEADLLPHTIPAALKKVDCLFIADDDSIDNSWGIIKSFGKQISYKVRRSDKISDTNYSKRRFSKQHLLDEVRKRFGTQNVWVQIIESDVALLDTDIRTVINKYAIDDISVRWHMINACRREWTPEYDLPRIPNMPLHEFYEAAHWMEQISCYTFRPLPEINYTERAVPWPGGFSHYLKTDVPFKLEKLKQSPLIIHYGFRSPTFYYNKMKDRVYGRTSQKYPTWDLSSPESVKLTVPFYNGIYNSEIDTFEITRNGWYRWLMLRKKYDD